MPGRLYVGTSGFSYTAWRGRFYPEKLPTSRMLGHYAQRLTGVELNGSFYRTPPETTLIKWAAETPPGFRLSFKGHRALTYSGEAFDKERVAGDIGGRLARAGDRLGPLLLQFPPTRQHEPGLLDRLLASLGLRAAVEFRHPSWFTDDVYRVLRTHGAALVVTDSDEWPVAPRIELPFAYYRLRRMAYDRPTLERWRCELRAEAEGRDEVYAYFRHEPEAPFWALSMLE